MSIGESRDLSQAWDVWDREPTKRGKTLVFLMIADGTGKCQQTPELNKDRHRSTIGFLCSASCLKILFIAVQLGGKNAIFFSTCEVHLLFFPQFLFFNFIYNVTNRVESEKSLVWLGYKMHKCTVLLKSEIKRSVFECLIRTMFRFSQYFSFVFVWQDNCIHIL